MDPNATLAVIRDLQNELASTEDHITAHEIADELSGAIASLDYWLSNGGFLPEDWQQR